MPPKAEDLLAKTC